MKTKEKEEAIQHQGWAVLWNRGKGYWGVKRNRVRSLREMTSFYKGQKERGERVRDNVGMTSWSELLWLPSPCLLLQVPLKISIIFSLVP
jgi:hypothetical protein